MTISEMTNEELNHAVAVEVMGWDAIVDDYNDVWFDDQPWTFSAYLLHAWQVVEKLIEEEIFFSVIYEEESDGCYEVVFCENDTNYNDGIYKEMGSACNKSLPRSICEAALMAVRERQGDE